MREGFAGGAIAFVKGVRLNDINWRRVRRRSLLKSSPTRVCRFKSYRFLLTDTAVPRSTREQVDLVRKKKKQRPGEMVHS
ncbi:MAG: hypothetical protein BJ554DRAFT_7480 [Olpidium bornovanus]|uniref:Uncharacterized protein n=1 Tax=Olpidium bornovanus TaxID=278681 RepID=A0A8H7ZVZ5_9FUNG|nr:MAG: hypothetical protein BJ554DRAFT_7480 [Olpidium bornovanus]